MRQAVRTDPMGPVCDTDDVFYGWRSVRRTQPDGTAIADDRPWLYDAVTGVRAPDHMEWRQTLEAAEARAQEEAQARAALEARFQALEAQLRQQHGTEDEHD